MGDEWEPISPWEATEKRGDQTAVPSDRAEPAGPDGQSLAKGKRGSGRWVDQAGARVTAVPPAREREGRSRTEAVVPGLKHTKAPRPEPRVSDRGEKL